MVSFLFDFPHADEREVCRFLTCERSSPLLRIYFYAYLVCNARTNYNANMQSMGDGTQSMADLSSVARAATLGSLQLRAALLIQGGARQRARQRQHQKAQRYEAAVELMRSAGRIIPAPSCTSISARSTDLMKTQHERSATPMLPTQTASAVRSEHALHVLTRLRDGLLALDETHERLSTPVAAQLVDRLRGLVEGLASEARALRAQLRAAERQQAGVVDPTAASALRRQLDAETAAHAHTLDANEALQSEVAALRHASTAGPGVGTGGVSAPSAVPAAALPSAAARSPASPETLLERYSSVARLRAIDVLRELDADGA